MDSSGNCIWDLWSSDEIDSDYDELLMERRQYKLQDRIDHLNKWNDIEFFRRFRLKKQTVATILDLIREKLNSKNERSRNLTPMTKLLLTLRFYASGTMLITIGDFVGVSKSTASVVIQRVSCAIASLKKDFIKMPQTDSELAQASFAFYKFAKFPRAIGAIDCTHVPIQSPGGDNAEHFRNRKGYFSINVQSVCSADMKFVNIVAHWPGSSHDQTIFNNSLLKMQLERGDLKNYIIVADSGYTNTAYMATPLTNCNNEVEQLYNESIIRTRNVVERKYGVWKRRFPVLSLKMRVKIQTVQDIIVAAAVLQNIAVDANEELPPNDCEVNTPLLEAVVVSSAEVQTKNNVRSKLLRDYFPTLL